MSRYFTLPLLATLLYAIKGEAKPSASAGILERQVEREYQVEQLAPTKEVPLLEIDIPEKRLEIPEGASAYIKTIRLEGNTVLSSKELKALVSPYEGREISGKDVAELCSKIDAKYAKKGYILAWTYPPIQEVKKGALTLNVLEGHLSSVEVQGNTFYKDSFLTGYFKRFIGKPINYHELIKSLILLNENQDLTVRSLLRKGKERGGVTIALLAKDSRPASFHAGYNNWGSNVTTYNQISTKGYVGNLIHQGDSFEFMTSFGVPPTFYYLNPSYSIPINFRGTYLGIGYTYSQFYIQQNKPLDLSGFSATGTIAIRHPLARTTVLSTDIFGRFDLKQVENLQGKMTASYDRLRVLAGGFSLDYIDRFKGRTLWNTELKIGIPNLLGGSPPISTVPSREGGGARYYICNMNLQRIQTLPSDFSLVFTSGAQGTFNKLPVPEQFYLGGIGSVRGYESAVAVGDVGYLGNLELYIPPPFKDIKVRSMNKPWKEVLKFLVFVDHGGIYTNFPVLFEESPAYLTGAGFGLRFYGPRDMQISFDVAFPITELYKSQDPFFYVRANIGAF